MLIKKNVMKKQTATEGIRRKQLSEKTVLVKVGKWSKSLKNAYEEVLRKCRNRWEFLGVL